MYKNDAEREARREKLSRGRGMLLFHPRIRGHSHAGSLEHPKIARGHY